MSSRKHAGVPAQKLGRVKPEERITYKGLHETEQHGQAVEAEVAKTVVDIQGMIDEVLQGKPFELQDSADAFKSGAELLQQLKPTLLSGMSVQIESGRSEPANMEMPLMLDERAYGMTLPGIKNEHGKYGANQDGMFMAHDAAKGSFTAGIVHNDMSTPESGAMSNLETVSCAYDVTKLREPSLKEMVFRMNNRIAPLEQDLGNSFPRASLLRLKPTDVMREYDLEVTNNGSFRTLVISKEDESVRSTEPTSTRADNEYLATLYDRPAMEVLDTMIDSTPSTADRELLQRMRAQLESGKLDQDQIRRILRNFLLEPKTENLAVKKGDLVVMVPDIAVEEFGGPEVFAKYFSTLIREGQSLQNVCRALLAALEKTMSGEENTTQGTENFDDVIREVSGATPELKPEEQHRKPLLEQSMSILAFEVPELL